MPQLLHRVLVAEVNALQGMAAIGQRPLLMEVSEFLLSLGHYATVAEQSCNIFSLLINLILKSQLKCEFGLKSGTTRY